MSKKFIALKKILHKICVENDIDESNVFINEDYGYVETVNHSKRDADYCRTTYRGVNYKVKYVSGCFNPFILEDNE